MKKQILLMVCFALYLLTSCGGEKKEQQTDKSENSTNNQQSSEETTSENTYTIKDKNGATWVQIAINGDDLTVDIPNKIKLKGVKKDAEKTKYSDEKGTVVAEVKYKDESFKLRTPDGKLLWKVKLSGDKIKISNNEENENPYEIKKKDNNNFKIEYQEKELGKTKFSNNVIDIDGIGTDLKVPARQNLFAYGVLLLYDIPETERYILLAELLKKGL
ncbi:MAG: hypothetical protein EAZ55_05015 [Cytophagales bacterium]|nr:MAG: hypothetical protein EAZ55_05015 [Cytophagales bacterium]